MPMNSSPPKRDVVIIGGGPAAHRLVDAIHSRDDDPKLTGTVIAEEPHEPYDPVALSLRPPGADDLTLQPSSPWPSDRIAVRTATRAVSVDPDARTVALDGGEIIRFDDLVFATGSSAPVPEISGAEHARVYRTIDDVDFLRAE